MKVSTIWVLVHVDLNYPVFFRPDTHLTFGPYIFTHERAALKAALDFPSEDVVARPASSTKLLRELQVQEHFTGGVVINPPMENGFKLYEGVIPFTRAGATFADALTAQDDTWTSFEEPALKRFALDVTAKLIGLSPMD